MRFETRQDSCARAKRFVASLADSNLETRSRTVVQRTGPASSMPRKNANSQNLSQNLAKLLDRNHDAADISGESQTCDVDADAGVLPPPVYLGVYANQAL